MFEPSPDKAAETEAYAAVGRLLITWSRIDQAVIRCLWRRGRTGSWTPKIPSHFAERFKQWALDKQATWPTDLPLCWEDFELEQAEALAFRNAFAHWILDVHGRERRFSVAVQPHELGGVMPAFERWLRRVAHMPIARRHPGPASGEVTRFFDWHLEDLQARWDALLALTTIASTGFWSGAEVAAQVLARPKVAFLK